MRKLQLKLEKLEVESFATGARGAAAGTVRANLDAAAQIVAPVAADSDCMATVGPCTCEPIETCSCGPTVPDTGAW
jgi:hypothetical protein